MFYAFFADLGEYDGFLPKQQLYNVKEITSFYKMFKQLSQCQKKAKLAEILQQPVMVDAYRTAGLAPQQISDYVESVLNLSEAKQNGMVADLYTIYGMSAARADNKRQIGLPCEWKNLSGDIAKYLAVPIRKFVVEHSPNGKLREKFVMVRQFVRWVKTLVAGSNRPNRRLYEKRAGANYGVSDFS